MRGVKEITWTRKLIFNGPKTVITGIGNEKTLALLMNTKELDQIERLSESSR
jgi:hypothetical protein